MMLVCHAGLTFRMVAPHTKEWLYYRDMANTIVRKSQVKSSRRFNFYYRLKKMIAGVDSVLRGSYSFCSVYGDISWAVEGGFFLITRHGEFLFIPDSTVRYDYV